MNQRFEKLFSLQENQYSIGAPVIIAAGDLLKDTQSENLYLRIKLQNISDKAIKAVRFRINQYDISGIDLNNEIEEELLDLNIPRDGFFGQDFPFLIKNRSTRSYSIIIKEVCFSDNSVWNGLSAKWEMLAVQEKLSDNINNAELLKQYTIEYGGQCNFKLLEISDLWFCVCGHTNHRNEKVCPCCGQLLSDLRAIDTDSLLTRMQDRLMKEEQQKAEQIEQQKKQEEEQIKQAELIRIAEKEKKKKRLIKLFSAFAAASLCITLITILISYLTRSPDKKFVHYSKTNGENVFLDINYVYNDSFFTSFSGKGFLEKKDGESFIGAGKDNILTIFDHYPKNEKNQVDQTSLIKLTKDTLYYSLCFVGFTDYPQYVYGKVRIKDYMADPHGVIKGKRLESSDTEYVDITEKIINDYIAMTLKLLKNKLDNESIGLHFSDFGLPDIS